MEEDELSTEEALDFVNEETIQAINILIRAEGGDRIASLTNTLDIMANSSRTPEGISVSYIDSPAALELQSFINANASYDLSNAWTMFSYDGPRMSNFSRRASVGSKTKAGFVGIVHSEVTIPKTRAFQTNLSQAMDTMVETLSARGKELGAKSVRNISIDAMAIGDSLIGLIGIGDAYKTLNNPLSNFKTNPDTCCIICGSCDDPCDCEDNPPAGTFSETKTRAKVKKILQKEGGAAGLKPLKKAFPQGTTKRAMDRFIQDHPQVYKHEDGDYILESKKNRKYKGHIISKVSTGWMVEAYDQSFKTLKQARDFINERVSGSAAPNQQCVRIVKGGSRCKGTVILVRSKKYRCGVCKAEYQEA